MTSYFTTLNTASGANNLDTNPCNLLDFQLVELSDGQTHSGNSGDREVLAVVLGGKATITAGSHRFEKIGGRANVFAGKPHSVYIPCHTDYTLTGVGAVEIGLCSAPSDLTAEPYQITPDEVLSGRWGAANFSRNYHQILVESVQPQFSAKRLIVGETYTPSGNWSTYPPHKHEVDNLPTEAFHEEMYFFKVDPADGFGIARFQNDELETNYTVRNNTILMVPNGFHTVASAPGYTTYYLWFLAGNHRTQAVMNDPVTGWVGDLVPTLRKVGL
ncbi:MAG: 5-deoxy-glucuronate isomerase [Anaerolineaceae bacterium]|nr:5-deoxy-glucuronate isomerase [Anaerolineaceae bacterium]